MKTLINLLKTMRPAQWVKNLFVLAPVVFAKEHTANDPTLLLNALLGTVVFILLSGAVYVMNDILDVERDRIHPIKRNRPVASGLLSIQAAMAGGLISLAVAYAAGYLLGPAFNLIATFYLALNVFYSSVFKRVAWLDVISIATGFLLRILGGCFAIKLAPREISYYLIACTFLVALFLAIGKRKHELALSGNQYTGRSSLRSYRVLHLDIALYAVAALTIVAYAIYTVSGRTRDYFFSGRPDELLGSFRLVFTVPFVIIGIFRYTQLLQRIEDQQSPTDRMIRDVPFVLNIVVWGIVVIWAIYG